MTCRHVHTADGACMTICGPGPGRNVRRIIHCPTCNRRRRFVAFVEWEPSYYAPRWTCCGCGDSWADGEMLPRPFARGWRQRSTAEAKRKWAS